MTPDQIGPFLERAALTDPRILPTDEKEGFAAVAVWAVALADVDYTFAVNAVAQHYANSPFLVKPADITTQWRAHVKNAANRHVDPIPATDDPTEYRAQILASRRATQHGAGPTPRAALGPGRYDVSAATSYSEDDIKAIRAEGDFKRLWSETQRAEKAKADERKRLVLQHDDLAEALRIAHGLSSADKWNGRIPPETLPSGLPNRSPIRAALVRIVAEAERRQQAAQRPAA